MSAKERLYYHGFIFQEMEKLVEMGLVKGIGVSNFTRRKISDLLHFAEIKPAVNQGKATFINCRTDVTLSHLKWLVVIISFVLHIIWISCQRELS